MPADICSPTAAQCRIHIAGLDDHGNPALLSFPGQYYDAETGHDYNYMRDYDQSTARYIESDPIGLLGGVNTYAYVHNNPISWADLKGELGTFYGGELHFLVGGGLTALKCTDQCGKKHTFRYLKVCIGGAIGGSGGAGVVGGVDGKSCNQSNYAGWFYEAGISAGPVSFGGDVGYNSDGPGGAPGSLSGVLESSLSVGFGAKIKSTWCYYFPI